MMKYKMYCIFADESVKKMNGVRGKLASMSGHAYLHAYWDSLNPEKCFIDQVRAYMTSDHAYKITLRVSTVDELKAIQEKYKNICGTSLVTDAGLTVFSEPTTTCLGLGPISEDKIGDDLKALKTFT
jgi:peptidyl-tRNA hydrolase